MKNIFNKYKEIRKNPRGRALLFFGFYLVFFIVLLIVIKLNSGNSTYKDNDTNNKYNTSGIDGDNYKFSYTINLDGVVYNYSGSRYNDKYLFTYNNNSYYRYGNNYYINSNGWSKIDNPIVFSNIIDNSILLIDNSYMESTTKYNDGEVSYNLLISSNSINKLINGINTDYDEIPNSIIISGSNISHIKYNLNSYCMENKLCNNSLSIDINYSDFGSVNNIDNPIS